MSENTTDVESQNDNVYTDDSKQVLDVCAAKPTITFADLMPRVTVEHNKSLGGQLKDMASLCLSSNKVAVDEYYAMCLFDDEKYSHEEKKTFVGLQKSRKIWQEFFSRNKFLGLVDDKLMFERLLNGFNIRTTNTLALTGGGYPGNSVNNLSSVKALKQFFETVQFPIFGKPLRSQQSLGSALFEHYDAMEGVIHLSNGNLVKVEELWEEISTRFDGSYLFQTCIEPHSFFSNLCSGGLPTVRVVTIDRGHGAEIYRCVAKLTSAGNVADNFWRKGNLLAPVDVEAGVMGKALTQLGIDGEFLAEHPLTGQSIEGASVPHWNEVIDMALDVTNLLSGVGLMGFDIAIGKDGPIMIEGNNDPQLIMLQIAHCKGVLDTAMLEAIKHAECKGSDDIKTAKRILAKERMDNKQDMTKALSAKAAA